MNFWIAFLSIGGRGPQREKADTTMLPPENIAFAKRIAENPLEKNWRKWKE